MWYDKENFLPYPLAKKVVLLKFTTYFKGKYHIPHTKELIEKYGSAPFLMVQNDHYKTGCMKMCAPSWIEVFSFFKEKYYLLGSIIECKDLNKGKVCYNAKILGKTPTNQPVLLHIYGSYEEVRIKCVEKMVELAEDIEYTNEVSRLKTALLKYLLSYILPKKWFNTELGFMYHFDYKVPESLLMLNPNAVPGQIWVTDNQGRLKLGPGWDRYWFKPGELTPRVILLIKAIKKKFKGR